MPEGHTLRRLADSHRALFAGQLVHAASPQGRFAAGAAAIDGRRFQDASAHGKHLLHEYAGGLWLHVHLGLYGRFTDGAGRPPAPVGEVRLRLWSRRHWLDLRGPATCEVLGPPGVEALLARLGPDPLRDVEPPASAYTQIARSGRPLMALLMDQSVVAGAGLIYVTEALYRAGVRPATPGRRLTTALWAELWGDLRELMAAGVLEGRIDTVRATHTPEAMGRAPRVDRHGGEVYVYRRAGQPCHVCGTTVEKGEIAGRNAYWCPTCQPA